jgi:uncharacterized protein (TIGR02246 family)
MRRKQLWGLVAAISLLVISYPAYSDDAADVRELFEKDIRLFNALNAEAFSTASHDEVVVFGILSPFATLGKTALRDLVAGYLNDHTRLRFTAVNPQFLVAGASALAWGHYTILEVPKVGSPVTIHGRYTFTYSKIDGKWLLSAMHLSPLQGY